MPAPYTPPPSYFLPTRTLGLNIDAYPPDLADENPRPEVVLSEGLGPKMELATLSPAEARELAEILTTAADRAEDA